MSSLVRVAVTGLAVAGLLAACGVFLAASGFSLLAALPVTVVVLLLLKGAAETDW